MKQGMLPVFGCSTHNYLPTALWRASAEECGMRVFHKTMDVPESVAGGTFGGDAWYWCTANKPRFWADYLEQSEEQVNILSDCDIVFFPNGSGWSEFLDWFSMQKEGIACARQGDGVLNSGLFFVRKDAGLKCVKFLREMHLRASAQKLAFGDQTALNEILPELAIIPEQFTVPGDINPYIRPNKSVIYFHGYGTMGDFLVPQQGGEPNEKFFSSKLSYMTMFARRGKIAYEPRKNASLQPFQQIFFPQELFRQP
jgi:hypothetical protein